MQQHLSSHTDFMEDAMSWLTQSRRRELYPLPEDEAQRRRDPMPFLGDREGEGADAPPLAWVIMWRGQYKNEFGRSVKDRFKEWGFVFWDCKRLKESGKRKTLVRDLPDSGMRRPRRQTGAVA